MGASTNPCGTPLVKGGAAGKGVNETSVKTGLPIPNPYQELMKDTRVDGIKYHQEIKEK